MDTSPKSAGSISTTASASVERARPRNISDDTWSTTLGVIAWGTARFAGCRVLTEVVFGERRIDVLFVSVNDVVGVEIKGKRDVLGDRLAAQLREFSFYLPEVWLAVHQKWEQHDVYRKMRHRVNCLMITEEGEAFEQPPRRVIGIRSGKTPSTLPLPERDEMCCSRLLELLWSSEVLRIAQRTQVLVGPAHSQVKAAHLRKMLARLLTGQEIMTQVCAELRSRPLVGLSSDQPKVLEK